MNRFGIVAFPSNNDREIYEFFTTSGIVGQGLRVNNENIRNQVPLAVFFSRKVDRDYALIEICKQFPGKYFTPFDVGVVHSSPPGDLLSYTIDEKGFLPA